MNGNENQSNVYKVQMYVRVTEDDAQELRKSLAQCVFDDFEMTEGKAVFGVEVELDNLPPHEYVMALNIVPLEDGLAPRQLCKLLSTLPYKRKFIPIEFEGENSAALGFIDAEYYELHNYDPAFISDRVKNILNDMDLELPDEIYETPDDRKFLMSYFKN